MTPAEHGGPEGRMDDVEYTKSILAVLEETASSLFAAEKQLGAQAIARRFLAIVPFAGLAINYFADGDAQTFFLWLLGIALLFMLHADDRLRETRRQIAALEALLHKHSLSIDRETGHIFPRSRLSEQTTT